MPPLFCSAPAGVVPELPTMRESIDTSPCRRTELRELLDLSVSLGVVHVGYHLTGFVDAALAGRVGGETLAATGLGSALFFAFSVFGIGTVMGLDPIVAQNVGAGYHGRAGRAMWQGYYAGLLVTLPLSLVMLWVGSNLTRFGIAPSLAGLTQDYLLGRLPSLWPLLACVSMRSYLQATHHTRPIVIAVIGLNIFNAVADWVLIFGDAGLIRLGLFAVGLPPLGVTGVAWSSTVSTIGQLGVLTLAVRGVSKHAARPAWVDSQILARLFSVGAPLGLQLVAEVGVFAGVGLLMGRMGTEVMAAHQVALQMASMTFAVTLGIGSAASVQVGRAIGRGDQAATRRAGFSALAVGIAFMALMATLMLSMPASLARIMTSDSKVIPAAARLVVIAGVFQIADGVQAVGSGALRGAGVTRWTFAAHLLGHWLVGAPVGLTLAFALGLGPQGLWWGLTAGLAAVAIALATKFAHLSSRPIKAIDSPAV